MSLQFPVFPLNTVAFPGTPVVLHIFEERYCAMVRDMEQGEMRFCVALILEGQEVGGGAVPHTVGTLVKVVHLDARDDQYTLVAIGTERVKITALDRYAKPYTLGKVEAWPEQCKEVEQALLTRTACLFAEYAKAIMQLSGETPEEMVLPTEADKLSYVVATELQIRLIDRQHLLEVPTTTGRLKAEIAIMQAELPLLRMLQCCPEPRRKSFGPFSHN